MKRKNSIRLKLKKTKLNLKLSCKRFWTFCGKSADVANLVFEKRFLSARIILRCLYKIIWEGVFNAITDC